ncbi:DNA-dependent metalloprotease SPRTN-like [Chrysoperla carnea]|uniref:DNA-dependent metalloprotease SPRTN-like n=1 Tax=Chrysoperla carnea TaxID=189513 RepID=UPI001D07406B|nr:DNA-dependent metalloprotease SPRTN-like [Chrysoperla carnea]
MEGSVNADYILALRLQQQLEMEENSTPIPCISEKEKYNNKNNKNKENLIDPSWELIDPTPNIFTLFIQFDKRFFYNKLNAVIVKWSKRMTTCAGICSYEGRGGACTVSLSEPLLKLRPRKDLIETLLHEMIHAYLFVTHNNRDRDGHGPEFHKHMYRINNEAGTNITVYHNFHDEVRLYKTHWWRCNGPCQNQRPFYGMVKRASNRAPGPNDRWWAQHQSICNGTFIKIREPDKKSKKTGELATKSVPITDIRKYLHDSNSNKVPVKSNVNKIHTMGDLSIPNKNMIKKTNSNQNKSKPPQTAQIQTFKDLDNKSKTGGSAVMNKGSGTIVVRGTKTDGKDKTDSNPLRINNFKPFSGSGYSLHSSDDEVFNKAVKTKDSRNENQQATVRNVWANKYPASGGSKRHISEPAPSSSKKLKKVDDVNMDEIYDYSSDNELFQATKILENEVKDPYKNVRDFWANKYPDTNKKQNSSQDSIESITSQSSDVIEINKKEIPVIDLCGDEDTVCPICSKSFKASEINDHIDLCLESSFNNDFEDLEDVETINKSPKKQINCLVCNKSVSGTELNAHLETCMTDVFEDEMIAPEPVVISEFDSEIIIPTQSGSRLIESDDDKLVRCPCCPRVFKESEINAHLDVCAAL